MSGRFTPPKRALVIAADVPDDASEFDKERAVRRRLVLTTGSCPCGGVLEVPANPEPGSLTVATCFHEPDCPACDP